jgi:hypothetical protein
MGRCAWLPGKKSRKGKGREVKGKGGEMRELWAVRGEMITGGVKVDRHVHETFDTFPVNNPNG